MDIGSMYGILVALVVGLTWLGRDHVTQKLGILLLTAWASTNIVVNYMGFEQAPLLNPSIDAVIAILVAALGYTHRSRLALVVFLLYVVVGATHVIAWANHDQETRAYYDVLGILFLAQLFAVGGVGGRLALVHWFASRDPRFRPHPLGR